MNKNPFVLPGFGQGGPMGQNPILASMEMMRQAWEGLASGGGLDAAAMGKMMSVEEMDKRIADLRAVENWLRMNLSMLSSTIQGMEVQRATVATLKSFMDTGMAQMPQHDSAPAAPAAPAAAPAADKPRAASPLEEALGMKPSGQAGQVGRAEPAEDSGPGKSGPQDDTADSRKAARPVPEDAPGQADLVGAAASAAQGWWNLLQQQFQTLAAATAATAESAAAAAHAAPGPDTARGKAARKTAAASQGTRKAAGKTASAGPAKVAKTARKTSAAGKTARKTVRKTARKTAN